MCVFFGVLRLGVFIIYSDGSGDKKGSKHLDRWLDHIE